MTVQEAQSKISSSEFIEWLQFFEWEEFEEFSSEAFYLAQIAAEIRRGNVAKPKQIKVSDFLLKFEKLNEARKAVNTTDKQTKESASKSFWKALVNFPKSPKKLKDK